MDMERQRWIGDLRTHAREIAKLSRELDRLAPTQARGRPDALFLQAQLTRHHISMALLSARLSEAVLTAR